jgi:hypothetical protein
MSAIMRGDVYTEYAVIFQNYCAHAGFEYCTLVRPRYHDYTRSSY